MVHLPFWILCTYTELLSVGLWAPSLNLNRSGNIPMSPAFLCPGEAINSLELEALTM